MGLSKIFDWRAQRAGASVKVLALQGRDHIWAPGLSRHPRCYMQKPGLRVGLVGVDGSRPELGHRTHYCA